MIVQTKLMAILFWPTWLAKSTTVNPFLGSVTVISLALPVSEPSGSPLARASADGAGMFARSASVIGFGASGGVAGVVAAGGAVVGVCAKASGEMQSAASNTTSNRLIEFFILTLTPFSKLRFSDRPC